MSNLSDRIALVLQSEPASEAVAAIITEARAELHQVEHRHAEARATAIDPLTTSAAASEARRKAGDLSLQAERLAVALDRLQSLLEAAQAREENARRLALYEAVAARREAMAQELREQYPKLAGELVALLQRLQAVEAEVDALAYPEGVQPFGSVEADARDVPAGWCIALAPISRLAKAVRLPAFDGAAAVRQEHFWPPREAPIEFRPVRPAVEAVANDAAA